MRHMSLELNATSLEVLNEDLEALTQKWSQRRSEAGGKMFLVMMLVGPG